MSASPLDRDGSVLRVIAKGHLNTIRLSVGGAFIPNIIAWVLTALLIYYLTTHGVGAPITINDEVVPREYNAWILVGAGAVLLGGIVFGALLMQEAIRQQRRFRDLGASILELEEPPVAPGGHFVGILKTGIDTDHAPPEGFEVKLEYVFCEPLKSDESGGTRTILWRDEKRMRARRDDELARLAIPISFDMPAELPGYKTASDASTYWQLTVGAALPEGSFYTGMKIPVEERDEPPEEAPVQATPSTDEYEASAYEMPARNRPLSNGVEVHRMASSLEMHFHPKLRYSDAIMNTLGAVIGIVGLGLGIHWMFFEPSSACGGFFMTLFAALLVFAFGRPAFKQWFYAYSVRVSGNEVIVRYGLPRWPTEKHLRASDLASIGVRTTDKTYGLALHRKDGGTLTVPANLRRKDQADRLAKELADAAGLPLASIA